MARGRSPGYEDQREQILLHAAELFAQSGYSATSMNEVAQASGMSKPTIYHYFRDKYALLFEISHTGRSVIMATHDYTHMKKFNTRVVRCEDSKLLELSAAAQA